MSKTCNLVYRQDFAQIGHPGISFHSRLDTSSSPSPGTPQTKVKEKVEFQGDNYLPSLPVGP